MEAFEFPPSHHPGEVFPKRFKQRSVGEAVTGSDVAARQSFRDSKPFTPGQTNPYDRSEIAVAGRPYSPAGICKPLSVPYCRTVFLVT
jgi:hypothetical protein